MGLKSHVNCPRTFIPYTMHYSKKKIKQSFNVLAIPRFTGKREHNVTIAFKPDAISKNLGSYCN